MRLEQFEYVVSVADAGSMNAAAQKLHVSQQNISKSIKQLENELQVEIFYRFKKGVLLTTKGNLVYQFSCTQIEQYKNLQKRLEEIQCSNLEGTLSISAMPSGMSMIIPKMLSEFYQHYPKVHLDVQTDKLDQIIQRIEQGEQDLGIILYTNIQGTMYPKISNTLQLMPLLTGPTYFWVSKNSVYAKRGNISFAEANKERVLIDDSIELEVLKKVFAEKGLALHEGLHVKNLYILGQLIADGQGVLPDAYLSENGLLYGYIFENHPELIAVPEVSEDCYTSIGYVTRREKERNSLQRHAVRFLNSIAKVGE